MYCLERLWRSKSQPLSTHVCLRLGSHGTNMYKKYRNQLALRDFLNNVHISLAHRYVYIGTGKVANSTIKHILQSIAIEDTPFKLGDIHDRRTSPLLSPYQVTEEIFEGMFRDSSVTTFGFVRNPYTRLLSAYLDRVCRPTVSRRRLQTEMGRSNEDEITFGEFIEHVCQQPDGKNDTHWRPQNRELLHGQVELDYIGRFENFGADAIEILGRIFPERSDWIAKQLQSNRSPSKTSASERLVESYEDVNLDLVQRKYARDFEIYQYSMDLDA
jgi:hypothetical protein